MLPSSHLPHEIEVVADDLVVIGQGRVVAAGTKTGLLAGAGTHVAPPASATTWAVPSPLPGSNTTPSMTAPDCTGLGVFGV